MVWWFDGLIMFDSQNQPIVRVHWHFVCHTLITCYDLTTKVWESWARRRRCQATLWPGIREVPGNQWQLSPAEDPTIWCHEYQRDPWFKLEMQALKGYERLMTFHSRLSLSLSLSPSFTYIQPTVYWCIEAHRGLFGSNGMTPLTASCQLDGQCEACCASNSTKTSHVFMERLNGRRGFEIKWSVFICGQGRVLDRCLVPFIILQLFLWSISV